MKTKNLIITVLMLTILTFTVLNISYGYWTDKLGITGEATFEFRTPVVKDIEMPAEILEMGPNQKPEENPEEIFKENTVDNPEESPEESPQGNPEESFEVNSIICNEAEEENESESDEPIESEEE